MKYAKKLLQPQHRIPLLGGIAATAVVGFGLFVLYSTFAAGPSVSLSATGVTPAGNASLVDDASASAGKVLQFGVGPVDPGPGPDPGPGQATCDPAGGTTLTVGGGGQYSSISEAGSAAGPGDLILISGGTYDGFSVSNSGSSGSPIKYCGVPGEEVVIQNGSSDRGIIGVNGQSHLEFINLIVRNSSNFGVYADQSDNLTFRNFEVDTSQDGGLVILASSNILVDGCEIHGTNSRGSGANHEALSIGEGSTNFEVRYCEVYDNGEEGIDAKYNAVGGGKIHNNIVYNCNGPNIYADSTNNVEIYNNISYGARGSSKAGIAVAAETAYTGANNPGEATNIKIYNNISYGNAGGGINFYTEPGGRISNVSIFNNTVVNNSRSAIVMATSEVSGDNPVFNNIFSGNDIGGTDGLQMGDNFTGDAQFVGGDNYKLNPGSPAIDAGVSAGAPAFDKDGVARPQGGGVDMGAYEQ